MPILNRDDAVEVESRIAQVFGASSSERAGEIRGLFVEVLDFNPAMGQVSLSPSPSNVDLPATAERVAELEGVHVLYVALENPETERVRKGEASVAARLIADQLGDDLLLVFTNASASQLHLIQPKFEGARPTLRRMVVERDLPRRTAVQQVSNIYWNHRDTGSVRLALDRAFDVEAVTKAFFDEYKRVFDLAMEGVEGFGSGEPEQESKKLFVQTLFNRLMFIYFLSRKGWLTFRGDNDYLNALWRDYQAADSDDKNFHIQRLTLLFFAGLNNPQSRDLSRNNPVLYAKIGAPPFLNGGLFEKTDLDKRTGVVVPDGVIERVLHDLFDRFNFTVMESTPFDIEVAVDPEMLGKVFEELVTGRHDTGSYYTPRPVVSFMCREALKGYLEGCDTGIAGEDVAAFVDGRDTSGVSLASAPKVAEALERVTVVDPACGSGAYLLGMMQELVDLRQALFNVGVDARSLYDLKLHIIQRNLYGVDIDEFAVNIAMLRMWLSLVIEYEGDTPEPLPNLDFKVVKGDTLLGPDPSPDSYGDLFRHRAHAVAAQLADLKGRHMESTTDKDALKEEIERVQDDLRDALADTPAPSDAVDWRVEFAEVFDRGGFDVAIANPPYVRFQKIASDYKRELKPLYGDAADGKSDLYCYFYVRALELLNENGAHVFVCSNSWLDVGYGAKLQNYMLKSAHVRVIYESVLERQFSTAEINTVISVIQKTMKGSDDRTHFVSLRADFDSALTHASNQREIIMTRQDLVEAGTDTSDRMGRRRFVGDKWGAKYLRAPDIYHSILRKVQDTSKLIRLGDIARVNRGIITGANKFFFLSDKRISEWGIEDEFIASVMTTPRESRSIAVDPARLPYRLFLCHRTKAELSKTGALSYINWGESQGFHRKTAPAARKLWYSLRKIEARMAINIFIGSTARTVLASRKLLFSDNFQVINSDATSPTKLATSMNSSFCQLVLNVQARANFGAGVLEVQTYEVEDLMIVNPLLLPEPDVAAFATTDWDVLHPSPERKQIDDAVFDVLGLTTGERDAVYEGVIELVENRKRRARSV